MFVFGLGMGLANTAMIIAIQASVDWSRRGVATALNTFARSMGGTLGVGALGGILAARLGMHLGSEKGAGVLSDTQRAALEQGLGVVFWVIAAVAAVNALIALLYPESGPARAPAEPSPDGSHLRASRPPRRPPPLPAEPSPDGSRSRVRYPSTEPEGQRPVNRSPEPDESQPGKRGRGARGVRWIASGSLVPPWTDRTSVGRMVRMGQGVSREKSGRSGGFACDEEGVGSMDPA
jgi:MFS family permease